MPDIPDYVFIVDTEDYAGSFERQMCAYVTGRLGECEVGEEMAKIANRDLPPEDLDWFSQHVAQVADDHGCLRPVYIHPTPGWFNSGTGDHYRDEEWGEPHVTDTYRERRREQALRNQESLRCYSEEWHEQRIKEAEEAVPDQHTAFLSVAIFLHERPSDEILATMRERARKFAEERPDLERKTWIKDRPPLTITRFRLIEQRIVEDALGTWDP